MFRLLPLCLALFAASNLDAADVRSIMDAVYRAAYSKPLRYEGAVEVFSPSGRRSRKRWVVERKGIPGASRQVIRLLEPAEVKGVALLVVDRPGKPVEQWLYTPAVERARRVAPRSRGSRFFATDLSFEDLEEGDLDSNDYRMEQEQDHWRGRSCWRILAQPKQPSQYDRRLLWVDQLTSVILRADLFRDGRLVKRVLADGYSRKQEVWTPASIEVLNIQHGGRTVVELQDVHYDIALPDARFTIEALSVGTK